MTTIDERDLRLTFDQQWTIIKWDDSEFRKRRGHAGKAADVVGIRDTATGRDLFVIEIKDYPDHPLATVPKPADLAVSCAEKARDTLAQLVNSPPIVGRPDEPEVDALCRAFGATEHPLNVLIWVEDANEPPLLMTEFQAELSRAFRWLPTRAVSAATAEDLNELDGVAARRLT